MSTGLLDNITSAFGPRISNMVASLPGRLVEVNYRKSNLGFDELEAITSDEGGQHRTRIPVPREQVSFIPENTYPDAVRSIPAMPSVSMLKAMEAPEMATNARQEMAIAVEDLLGYTPLRKDAGAPSKLQRVLAELEITAFDLESVDQYKKEMQAHFQAKYHEREWSDFERANRLALEMSFFYPSDIVERMVRTRVHWNMANLQGYKKPIPEFVLNKAMQIKQHAPEATFFVDELREEKITLDPFLVVQIGEEKAWIEVWDEPAFEKKLYADTP